jgi:hypothetical protein
VSAAAGVPHLDAIGRALKPGDARVVRIDPQSAIPQRPERLKEHESESQRGRRIYAGLQAE